MKEAWPLLLALALAATPAWADAAPAGCPPVPDEGGRVCKSLETGVDVAARLCRNAGAPTAACDGVDGEPTSHARIEAYLASATHVAMDARFHADDAKPIELARWPSTHNSFNAEAYAPTLSGLDANQRYSILDQLRMDVRAVELGIHWWPSATGAGFAPVMCHAEDVGNGVHAGCTTERLFGQGLAELSYFLRQDDAADEVILLYVEDHLDGDPAAYAEAAASLAELSDVLLRPADTGRACADGLPLELSRADALARGKRLLVVASTCGEGTPWAGLVHSYHASVDQHGVEDLTPYPECGGASFAYGAKIVRVWEDATWLTYMQEPQLRMTPALTAEAARCGVGMVGFDLLDPGDGRLDALASS